MKRLMAASAALGASALVLAGCAATPLDRGIELCESKLQYEIEQAKPQPPVGWLDSELVTSDITSTPRDGGSAYDVSGTATVTLNDDSEVSVEWDCFTQTPEGSDTLAEIQFIDGACSTARRNAGADGC